MLQVASLIAKTKKGKEFISGTLSTMKVVSTVLVNKSRRYSARYIVAEGDVVRNVS